MCEPLTVASLAVGAAGTAVSIGAAGSRGRYAQAAGESSAEAAERAATDAIARSVLPGARIRMRGGKLLGAQESHEGESGAVVGAGSAGDLLQETQELSLEDAKVVALDAYREAYGLRGQARAYRQQGANAAAEASNSQLGAALSFAGGALAAGAHWLNNRGATPDSATIPGTDYAPAADVSVGGD